MEVSVGFSNTPIDAQTCKMLGLPLGLFVVYVYIYMHMCVSLQSCTSDGSDIDDHHGTVSVPVSV